MTYGMSADARPQKHAARAAGGWAQRRLQKISSISPDGEGRLKPEREVTLTADWSGGRPDDNMHGDLVSGQTPVGGTCMGRQRRWITGAVHMRVHTTATTTARAAAVGRAEHAEWLNWLAPGPQSRCTEWVACTGAVVVRYVMRTEPAMLVTHTCCGGWPATRQQ